MMAINQSLLKYKYSVLYMYVCMCGLPIYETESIKTKIL